MEKMTNIVEIWSNRLSEISYWLMAAGSQAEEESGIQFYNVKSLTRAEILFYIGVLVITILAIVYLVWRNIKANQKFFGKGDIPVETIKLHLKSDKELESEKKYKKEVEEMLKKKHYGKYLRK